MSGDNAPLAQIEGAVNAADEYREVNIALVGDRSVILEKALELGIDLEKDNISIVQSGSVITMEDSALSVVRDKRDSSMAVGLKMLSEGNGDAFISSGNTGALHAGSTLIVRRIKGIRKSAIATILPYANPTLMIDSGANVEIDADTYVQFAEMGSIYIRKTFGIESPRVGLLNIGAERTKGTKLLQEVYTLLENDSKINFIGNVEGKKLPLGACDVLVCDGFTGNIVLKLTEGCGSYFVEKLKNVYTANPIAKASGLAVKKGLKNMKKDFDASEYGGAPLLGLSKPVIKAHGGSDSKAIFNAVRQAISCVSSRVTYSIAELVIPKINHEDGWDEK